MNIDERTNLIYNEAVVSNLGEISCKDAIRKQLKSALQEQENKILQVVSEGTCGFHMNVKAYLISVISLVFSPKSFYSILCRVIKESMIQKIKER
jgi:hypothetical protein